MTTGGNKRCDIFSRPQPSRIPRIPPSKLDSLGWLSEGHKRPVGPVGPVGPVADLLFCQWDEFGKRWSVWYFAILTTLRWAVKNCIHSFKITRNTARVHPDRIYNLSNHGCNLPAFHGTRRELRPWDHLISGTATGVLFWTIHILYHMCMYVFVYIYIYIKFNMYQHVFCLQFIV